MKNYIHKGFYGLAILLTMFLSFGAVKVLAIDVGVNAGVKVEDGDSHASVNATSSMKSEGDEHESTSSKDESDDSNQGDEHKSAVAVVVQSLLSIANRDGGIGADVRVVANEQASTSAKIKDDMDNLNSESKVKVFILGPNYKNLGELRSSIVTTQNSIARLKAAESKTTDASVKADLELQIKALEDVSSSTQVFINSHDKASLFGWLIRVFVK